MSAAKQIQAGTWAAALPQPEETNNERNVVALLKKVWRS